MEGKHLLRADLYASAAAHALYRADLSFLFNHLCYGDSHVTDFLALPAFYACFVLCLDTVKA